MTVRNRIVVPEFSALTILSGGSNLLFPSILNVLLLLWITFAPRDLQAVRVARVSLAINIFVIIDWASTSEAMAIARCV
jgi:hypothetical protein